MNSQPKGAVVTGAGRGVGAALAEILVGKGFRVVLAARTETQLHATAAGLRERFGEGVCLPVVCDVGASDQVSHLADIAREFLGEAPRLLVNNAGIVHRATVAEHTEADWDEVLRVNLKGAFLCTRAFLPGMLALGRGRILQVASISATLGTPRLSAYCASKWALVGFTKSLAEELRGTGVQTMALSPGSVDTDMLRGSGFAPQMSPEQVAQTLAWLGVEAPDAMLGSAVEMFG